jgi:hypothetical protein
MQVAQCNKLAHLAVFQPSLYASRFLAFFSSPNMQQLRSLSLTSFFAAKPSGWIFEAVPADDFVAAFQSMHQLHSLKLVSIGEIDALLPPLAHASALRRLTVRGGVCALVYESTIPSAWVLSRLLLSHPQLHCTLELPLLADPSSPTNAVFDSPEAHARAVQITHDCAADGVMQQFGNRCVLGSMLE